VPAYLLDLEHVEGTLEAFRNSALFRSDRNTYTSGTLVV
jgi:hypothetical protein